MSKSHKWVIGNWKMNGTRDSAHTLVSTLCEQYSEHPQIVLCPPFTLLSQVISLTEKTHISIGAQNCHQLPHGAYTGNISPTMLKDLGCNYVILGHSECREYNNESHAIIQQKIIRAHQNNLTTIFCIGESQTARNKSETLKALTTQLAESLTDCCTTQNTLIAYEPIWAIGTGRTPTLEEITETHEGIRTFLTQYFPTLTDTAILYGGSVNASNAVDILALPQVNGVLVGGASLKADQFSTIINAAR